jgi:hypothetical protein
MKQIGATGEILVPHRPARLSPLFPLSGDFKVQHLDAKTDSSRLAGAHQAGVLLHTAPMLLVIILAICLAVVDVLYLPATQAAATVTMGRSLTPAPTSTAANPRVHESNRRR